MSPQPQPVISPSLGRLRQLDSVGRSPGGHDGGDSGEEGAVGTLNLVGWLSGMPSLFRQLQQLPMVSEQPDYPSEKHKR